MINVDGRFRLFSRMNKQTNTAILCVLVYILIESCV